MPLSARVRVEAEVRPTEDEGKVIAAISNLTGRADLSRIESGRKVRLVQEGDESLLIPFRAILRRDRIQDAARKVISKGQDGTVFTFHVNKQVASAGHISFCAPEGESPLGPITFTVELGDPKSLIDWLSTRTIDGHPVGESCQSESRHYARSEGPSRN